MNVKRVLMWFMVLVFIAGFAAVGFAEEKKTSNIENLKKQGIKVNLDYEAYSKKHMSKYVDLVWNEWVKKELKEKDILLFKLSKENVAISIVDINDDDCKDILASIVENDYFCGKFGSDCELKVFVCSSGKGYKQVSSCMSIFYEAPIYILNKKTKGLKNILVNDRFVLKFDEKQYCEK